MANTMVILEPSVASPQLLARSDSGIAIACVFYEAEADMAAMLARSLEQHLDPALAKDIVFLNNARDAAAGRQIFQTMIAPELPSFADRVRCLDTATLGLTDLAEGEGYLAQQLLKLAVADQISAPFCLIFDAKNHLIRPLRHDDIFAPDGRPRSHWSLFSGYLLTCLRESMALFGLTPAPDNRFLPTVTPNLLITDVVREMRAELWAQTGKDLTALLRENDRRTEFLLYGAHVVRRHGIERLYAMGPRPYATLFARWPERPEDIDHVLHAAETRAEIHTFGVHIRRYPLLGPKEAERIAQLWYARGLLPDVAAGLAFIDRQAGRRSSSLTPLPAVSALMPKPAVLRRVAADSPTPGLGGAMPGTGALPSPEAIQEAAKRDVLLGRDGRMFILNGTNRVMDQHRGQYLLTPEDVAAWPQMFEARRNAAHAAGAEYAMVIAPDSHAIYREDIPEFDTVPLDHPDHVRPICQIITAMGHRPRFCYPLDALRHARARGQVCHMADSHWSGLGAYRAYRRLLRQLPFDLHCIEGPAVQFQTRIGPGDLGDKLEPQVTGLHTDCTLRKPAARKLWDNGVPNRGYMAYWRNRNTALPRGLLFMDSYGWKLQHFLAESFSELFILHTPYYEPEAVAAFGPDVILSEMAERFVIRPPVPGSGPPTLASAREKRADARYPSHAELAALPS